MQKFQRNTVFLSLVSLIVGIILLVWPQGTLILLCRIVGIGFLIAAAANIAAALTSPQTGTTVPSILFSVLLAVIGILILARPIAAAKVIPTVAGILLILGGVTNLVSGFRTRQGEGDENGVFQFILAVLYIVLGIVIISAPLISADLVIIFIGVSLAYNGVVGLVKAFQNRNTE